MYGCRLPRKRRWQMRWRRRGGRFAQASAIESKARLEFASRFQRWRWRMRAGSQGIWLRRSGRGRVRSRRKFNSFCHNVGGCVLEQKRNLESRALARWIRTLTLILSLAGRGEDNAGWLRTALLAARERGSF